MRKPSVVPRISICHLLLPAALLMLAGCNSGGGGGDGGTTRNANPGAGGTGITWTISAAADPGTGGSITGAGSYAEGTSVTLTAAPAPGYRFVNWTENGTEVSTSADYTFTAAADRSLTAHFVIKSYSITTAAGAGGSISPASATINHGDAASFTVTPDAGYAVDTIAGCNGTLSGNIYTTGPVTSDCTINVFFTAAVWTISATTTALPDTAAPAPGGQVSGAGTYADGAAVTLTAHPASGFAFVGWEENGTTIADTARYTFTASADRNLTARFRLAQPLVGDMNDAAATRAVALADLNGDGHTDLVAVNGADQANGPVPTRVWFGNGAGGFIDSGQALPGGGNVGDLALGDLDGDGAPDLVLASQAAGAIVLHNNGKGTFALPGTAYKTTNAHSTTAVAIGDVDADGDLDFVAGNAGEVNTVWLNDGQGAFTDSGQRLGGFNLPFTASAALGDLNRDGLPDLVFGNLAFNNSIWMNTGQGQFVDSNQNLGAGDTTSVIIGDIDGDDDLDLVFGNSSNGVSTAWRNDGTGLFFFSTGQSLPGVGPQYYGRLAMGDIDGDGRPDLVIGNTTAANTNGGITTELNDGLGSFTASHHFSGNSTAVALADLGGDGDLDLVEGRGAGSGASIDQNATTGLPDRVWLNDGSGRFIPAVPVIRAVTRPWALALGHLNGDTTTDLVACSATDCAALLVGGSLLDGPAMIVVNYLGVGVSAYATPALGDLNGDGRTDIVIPAADGAHILLSNNNNTFTDTGTPLGASAAQAGLADLDGDGDLDLITAPDGQGDLRAWWNDGNAGFTGAVIVAGSPGLRFTALDLADLDGDGDQDLLVAAPAPLATAVVFRNNGDKTFTPIGNTGTGTGIIVEAKTADLDEDGIPDLLLGTDQGLTLYLGNGDGSFATPGQSIETTTTSAVAIADLDGDGDLDLAAAHDGPDTLWINDGQGHFSQAASVQAEGMTQTWEMIFADLDGDGDADLVTANRDGGIALHRNVVK